MAGSTDRERFVNPYTFVAISPVIPRRRPPGHDGINHLPILGGQQEQLFTGTLDLEWTLKTPLLLPQGTVDATDDGRVRVPGASIKGALRSVHEALFRGCLRVVDEAFVPSYRSAAAAKDPQRWTLGMVTASTKSGEPQNIRLCDDPVWIDGVSLRRAYSDMASKPGLPCTGDAFTVGGQVEETTLDRREMRIVDRVGRVARPEIVTAANGKLTLANSAPNGARVLLVTDTGARHQTKRNGERGRCLWATGRLTGVVHDVSEKVRADFRRASEGADDLRRLKAPKAAQINRRAPDPPRSRQNDATSWASVTSYTDVTWWRTYQGPPSRADLVPIARRALMTGLLFPGDVVWVCIDGAAITRIDYSQIWRELGSGSVKERTPREALPCFDPGFSPDATSRDAVPPGLCLSCETFGSVDAAAQDARGGRQSSYAGHVRFGTAITSVPVRPEMVDVAPLGAPRLGSGMFYLEDRTPARDRQWHDLPGQWGSAADGRALRPLRGRKFYWNSDPDRQAEFWQRELDRPVTPRHRRRPEQRDFGGQRAALPAGTVLNQTISVDGISDVGLQSLLATLEPARVVAGRPGVKYQLRIGGGKPLGLGSVGLRIVKSTIAPSADRYRATQDHAKERLGLPLPEVKLDVLATRLDPSASAALGRILDPEGLEGWQHHVSYPPGDSWNRVGSARFDESFRYFTENNGEHLKRGDRPWAPLPSDTAEQGTNFEPSQPITPRGIDGPTRPAGRGQR